jgi:DNA-binding transcriptional LysR family regulator
MRNSHLGIRAVLLSLNGVRAFEAVAPHVLLHHAADELNVTQTAISHQIRRLEQWPRKHLLLFPRAVGPTLYDTVIGACRQAGFEPTIGQLATQIASVVNLVAAELGVSMVPASMGQVRVTGVVYRPIAGQSPTARLALVHRRGETSPVVRNFNAAAAERNAFGTLTARTAQRRYRTTNSPF